MRQKTPFRAAVVGCGGISQDHAKAIGRHPQRVQLAACADIDLSRAQAWAEKFGAAKIYQDYQKMIEAERPDLVIICTWPSLHEEQVVYATSRQVPMILCEKSMAMSAAAAKRMADAATQSGSVLVEGYMGRHLPRTLELQRLVREGTIGRVRKIRAGFQRRALEAAVSKKRDPLYGGVTFDFTCYCVNAVGAFTSELPARVHAEWQRQGELVTELHGLLRYPDGLVAIIESSYTYSFHQPLELFGEAGILRTQTSWVGDGSSGIEHDLNAWPTKVQVLQTPAANRAECQLLHLLDCLESGRPPRLTIEESIRNHAVLDALLEAARTGQPQTPKMP